MSFELREDNVIIIIPVSLPVKPEFLNVFITMIKTDVTQLLVVTSNQYRYKDNDHINHEETKLVSHDNTRVYFYTPYNEEYNNSKHQTQAQVFEF